MSAADGLLAFATLIPQGSEAENALDAVCNAPDLQPHHRAFIHCEEGHRHQTQNSGSDSSQPDAAHPPQHTLTGAHFTLSLHNAPLQPFSRGWVSANDPAEVDLLLIRPGKSHKQVAPVHARIRMDCRSGVLMLVGADEKKPVVYRPYDSAQPILLHIGESHVLFAKCNSFSVGYLHYTLVFEDLSPEQYQTFVAQRNLLLHDLGFPTPHPRISAIPRHEHVKRGAHILRGTFASGKFGFVAPAVFAHTGEPVAVKEHRAKDSSDLEQISRESTLGMSCEVRDLFNAFAIAADVSTAEARVVANLQDLV
ncbi:MAG: hypothetical protein Q9180_005261 [Flavoplaca navasiana]